LTAGIAALLVLGIGIVFYCALPKLASEPKHVSPAPPAPAVDKNTAVASSTAPMPPAVSSPVVANTPAVASSPATTTATVAEKHPPPEPGPVPLAEVEITGTDFGMVPFKNGGRAFSNRDYVWVGIPNELNGMEFTQTAGRGTAQEEKIKASIYVKALKAGNVCIVTDVDPRALLSQGWNRTPLTFRVNLGKKLSSDFAVLTKPFAAGETEDIPQFDRSFSGTIVLRARK
jgi:hypothetical protein